MALGPRISVGQALTAWQCQRFAAKNLDPDKLISKLNDGTLRLSNAISVAILDAHRQFDDLGREPSSFGHAIELAVPPPELGHEEAARFRVALDAYEEQFGSDADIGTLTIHAKSETPLKIPVGHNGAVLSTNVKLAFSTEPESPHSGAIAIRSVVVGPLGNNEPDPRPDALRLAALGARTGLSQRLAVSPGGATSLTTHTYTYDEIKQTWRDFGEVVDAALAAAEGAPETPGWWCTTCPFLRGCPSIKDERFVDLVDAYPTHGDRS
jgi:hypothetical protein